MMRPRVVFWNNMPTPYVVGRLGALASRGNIDVEGWFDARGAEGRSWEVEESGWRFPARFLERRQAGHWVSAAVPYLRETRPDVLVSLYASASYAAGSFAARALGIRTAFRVVPTYDAWTKRSWMKELSKAFLFRSADGAIVPGPDGARMARRYGIPSGRIGAVTQSIDLGLYRRALELPAHVRSMRRSELGLRGCVFLYVGRLWEGKGLDYLFEAYHEVNRPRAETSLLLVGDGVEEARYRAMARELPNVVFAGFVQPRDLPAYYGLADASVFPTLGDPHGLVVEEAMAAGLPVICSEAAGDIGERLPDGAAGYIVPPANAKELARRMLELASDPELRKRLGAEAQRLVAARGHERWATDFEAFVARVLGLPPRRTAQSALAWAAGKALLRSAGERPLAPAAPAAGEERAA